MTTATPVCKVERIGIDGLLKHRVILDYKLLLINLAEIAYHLQRGEEGQREKFDGLKAGIVEIRRSHDLPFWLIGDELEEVDGVVKLIGESNYQEAYDTALRLHREASELYRRLLIF